MKILFLRTLYVYDVSKIVSLSSNKYSKMKIETET